MFREAKNIELLVADEAKFSDRSTTIMFVTDKKEIHLRENALGELVS